MEEDLETSNWLRDAQPTMKRTERESGSADELKTLMGIPIAAASLTPVGRGIVAAGATLGLSTTDSEGGIVNWLNKIKGASGEGIGKIRKRNYITKGKKQIDDPNWKPLERDEGNTFYNSLMDDIGFDFSKQTPDKIWVNMSLQEKVKQQQALNRDWVNFLEDIKTNGMKSRIIIDYNKKTNTLEIAEGNHRLTAANELGMKDVPIKYTDNVPEKLKFKQGQ